MDALELTGQEPQPPQEPHAQRFTLERFDWQTPDRLVVAGHFAGLEAADGAAAVLRVWGAGADARLPAVPESVVRPLQDGDRWSAEFAWQGPPVPIERAELEVDDELVVELPEPGTTGAVLEVSRRAPAEPEVRGPLDAARSALQEARGALDLAEARVVAALDAVDAERARTEAAIASIRADGARRAAALELTIDRMTAETEQARADTGQLLERLARIATPRPRLE